MKYLFSITAAVCFGLSLEIHWFIMPAIVASFATLDLIINDTKNL